MSTRRELSTMPCVEELLTPDALEAIRPEWSQLWERSPAATPFQSPEWLIPWWRHFGGAGLWTLALRRDGRLVGLAPLFIYTGLESGVRQVTLVGNGISDHLDLLLDPVAAGAAGAAGAAVLAHLEEQRDAWDTCDLRSLPAGSPFLSALLPGGIEGKVEEEEPCPTLRLPRSPDRLEQAVSGKLLAKLRYSRRRAERDGGVCFQATGADGAEAVFGALLELHGARWAARGERGVLDGPGVEAFHREVVRGFLKRGWLRLFALRVEGRLAAVHYGFSAKGRAYYYLGGFDPAFHQLSPGSLMVLHAIEEALREGAGEFDFLRGREAYKYAWGGVDRRQYRRVLRVVR